MAHDGPLVRFGFPKLTIRALGLVASLFPLSCGRKTEVVVALQSEPMGGALTLLHVVIKVGGVVARDEVLRPPERSPLAFPRPWEARLTAGRDESALVEVEVDAFEAVKSDVPLLKRLASTHFVPGREELLRIQLEPRCIVHPSAKRAPGSPPGPLTGPTCDAPETCIRGACQSGLVPPEKLEPYASTWATHIPDMCKPADGGAPTLSLGTGERGFASLAPAQVLQAEPGPQGGHHIWIAIRMKNMRQMGSTTTLSGMEPNTGVAIPPSTFAFPFDPDVGASCQLYGLRYQLDNGGIDYAQFLGKPLDVTATVVDTTGATASAHARIQVAPDLARGR
jgi:hypothetical protein